MTCRIKFNCTDDVSYFVSECNRLAGDVNVHVGHIAVDGKSILGMSALGIEHMLNAELLSTIAEDIEIFIKLTKKFAIHD